MKIMKRGFLGFFCIAVALPVVLFSCTTQKKVIYFDSLSEGAIQASSNIPENYIQKNDLLSISITSPNPDATVVFNSPSLQSGILVDPDGNIQIPLMGSIKAAGITKNQLKESIAKTLKDRKLLVDPIVVVRFLNFRVTVLGEVKSPQVVQVPTEKISLLEAIGAAGDLTFDANRENVLVIRDEGGQRMANRINLTTNEIFNSPYYYLKANDIVYVEPDKTKVRAVTAKDPKWVPYALTGLTVILSVATFLKN